MKKGGCSDSMFYVVIYILCSTLKLGIRINTVTCGRDNFSQAICPCTFSFHQFVQRLPSMTFYMALISLCPVRLLHSQWLNKISESALHFALIFKHSFTETNWMINTDLGKDSVSNAQIESMWYKCCQDGHESVESDLHSLNNI